MFGKKKVSFERKIDEEKENSLIQQEMFNLREEASSKDEEISALCKELEQFYLEAIDNAETVDEVKAILSMYHESELFKISLRDAIAITSTMRLFTGICTKYTKDISEIAKAAETKTKELNRKWINEVCEQLDNYKIGEDEVSYADHMMELLKVIANIEADGKAILDAWKSGLDAWRVFLSMLSVYGVKQADVLGAE